MKPVAFSHSTKWGICIVFFAMLASPVSCSTPNDRIDDSSSSSLSSGGGTSNQVCIPGQQIACACPGGFSGAQACNEQGSGYDPCQCESSTGGMGGTGGMAGMGGAGGTGGTGGVAGMGGAGGMGGTGGMASMGGAGGMGGSMSSNGGTGGTGGMSECSVDTDCTSQGMANFCGKPVCSGGICMRQMLQPTGTSLPSQLYGDCLAWQCDIAGDVVSVPNDNDAYDDANGCTNDICMQGMLSHPPIAQGTLCSQPTGAPGICNGNGACVACIDGVQGCTAPYLCTMNSCVGTKCINGMKDPGESDIDCGAASSQCQRCANGKACTQGTQCMSGICIGGTCAAPMCMDAVKNGSETGFDCGGPTCPKCPSDESCALPSDCQSGVCIAGICVAPACNDAVQNGNEMGIDCGGSCMTPCP
ncbi:MAG TPA: hypothetical protein PK156_30185 [Polyangium sp.]|nr:hypothetical protein [Polyangium sp.]